MASLGPFGPYPQYGWDFPEEIPERPRKRSQSVSGVFRSRVRLGCPKPYNSRHLRLPERFQNSLPPSTAGDVSFFQNWFRRGPLRAGHGIPSSTGGISDPWSAQEHSSEHFSGIPSQVAKSTSESRRSKHLRTFVNGRPGRKSMSRVGVAQSHQGTWGFG